MLNGLWSDHWNMQEHNKFHSVQPCLGFTPLSQYTRREGVVLRRCRIGHSYFTHSFILKRNQPHKCVSCQSQQSVQHSLLDCVDFAPTKDTFY